MNRVGKDILSPAGLTALAKARATDAVETIRKAAQSTAGFLLEDLTEEMTSGRGTFVKNGWQYSATVSFPVAGPAREPALQAFQLFLDSAGLSAAMGDEAKRRTWASAQVNGAVSDAAKGALARQGKHFSALSFELDGMQLGPSAPLSVTVRLEWTDPDRPAEADSVGRIA